MRKFNVKVQRVAVQELTISVEADSEGEAEDKAYEQAGSHDFSGTEKSADYEVIDIKEAGGQ
jgi:hypothetical protein